MSEDDRRTPGPRDAKGDMKGDWDARARENAMYYIATTNWESEERFDDSGRSDVEHFFSGLEHVLGSEVAALDIGCGVGRMDRFVAPRVGRLTGIDVSGEMVARARTRLADLPNVEFVEGDGTSLAPIADASLDLVFSHVVFQHVPRGVFQGYLPEVRRVLRPGGSFVFQLPTALVETPPDPPDDNTFDLRFWREEDVRRALEGAGLALLECRRFAISEDAPVEYLRLHARR